MRKRDGECTTKIRQCRGKKESLGKALSTCRQEGKKKGKGERLSRKKGSKDLKGPVQKYRMLHWEKEKGWASATPHLVQEGGRKHKAEQAGEWVPQKRG